MSSNPASQKKKASVLSIPSNTIYPNVFVDFTVYYKNRNNQYKKLLNAGSHYTYKIKKQLEEKLVQKLYILQADKAKYLSYRKKAKEALIENNPKSIKSSRAVTTRVGTTVAPVLPTEPSGFVRNKTADMDAIPMETIKADTVVTFPVYYRGSDNAIKKLLTKGNTVTGSVLEQMNSPRIKQLFVKKEDKGNYKRYIQDNTPPFALAENLSLEEKSRAIYSYTSSILQDLFKDPRCAWSFGRAKSLVEHTVDVVASDTGAIKAFTDAGMVDYDTHTHSLDVAVFAIGFGQHLGFDRNDMVRIGHAGLFHDIGKSQIDPEILDKPGPLDPEEFEIVKKHAIYSNFILRSHAEKDKDILDAVKHHHERFDGTGYPQKLKEKEIPLFAQIIAITDIYDAVSSKKSYRDANSSFETLNIMKSEMGNHFDKRLLMEFIKFMGPQYR